MGGGAKRKLPKARADAAKARRKGRVVAASKKKASDASTHKEQLDNLKASDPSFFKYLQETDKNAAGARPKQRAEPVPQVDVSSKLLKDWRQRLEEGVHRPTLVQLIGAFRDAVRFGDEAAEAAEPERYIFHSAHVFNELMQYCVGHMDTILWRHISGGKAPPLTDGRAGAKRGTADSPDTQPHWRKHQPLVKSYLTQLVRFLDKLTEASMALVVLQQLHRMVSLVLVFPKLIPKAIKALLRAWGRQTDSTERSSRLLAYATVRRLVLESPQPLFDEAFKGLYLTYARTSSGTTRASLPRLVLMSSCIVDLAALDSAATYQLGFVYIRQLAIHLRNATQKTSDAALRQVYSWQYLNCLRLWTQILCAHAKAPDAALRQLLYPLVQVTLGVARLRPSICFAPIRFQCARTLNQLSRELGVFIPVAPILLEVFGFANLSKSPAAANATDRLIDWAVLIKVSKADSEKRKYQEGMATQALYLLGEYLFGLAYDIAFPEAAAPTLAALRKVAKGTKIISLKQRAQNLVAQADAHAAWLLKARGSVDFSPRDADKVALFLAEDREAQKGPLAKWYALERDAAERREAELRKSAEAGAVITADDEGEEDSEDDDDDDGEAKARAAKAKQKKQKKSKAAEQLASRRNRAEPGAAAVEDDGRADTVKEFRLSDLDSDDD